MAVASLHMVSVTCNWDKAEAHITLAGVRPQPIDIPPQMIEREEAETIAKDFYQTWLSQSTRKAV